MSTIIFQKAAGGKTQAELTRFARRARKLVGISSEVTILIADNRQLRALNRRFRHKDKATDVLSFPRKGGAGGDIAISADQAKANAARYGHNVLDELKVLVLHGMLHLAGHDHETDSGQMAARELALRARLKLPATLIDRTLKSGTKTTRARRRKA